MLFNFLLPYLPFFGLSSPFVTSFVVNVVFLLAYSFIFKSKFNEKRLIAVSFILVPIDFLAFLISALITDLIITTPYRLWGNWMLMDELIRHGSELIALGGILGGAILGYVSSFAFIEVNRKHLIATWIATNSISMLLIGSLLVSRFCGFPPYMC